MLPKVTIPTFTYAQRSLALSLPGSVLEYELPMWHVVNSSAFCVNTGLYFSRTIAKIKEYLKKKKTNAK